MYDDSMKTAWACMWRITEASPSICQTFTELDFLTIFKNCMEKCKERQDIVTMMLRVAENVAQNDASLMDKMESEGNFIHIVCDTMNSSAEHYEVPCIAPI